jgi:hypothetical protein
MLLLPDRQNLSFPCDRDESDHHHHHHRRAVHRDHRDAFPENLRARLVQRPHRPEAAVPVYQSRLDGDAERPARSVEDAADPTAAVQESVVLTAPQEQTTQAARGELRVLRVQDAVPLEQKEQLQQVLRPWALPLSQVLRQREALRLPLQAAFPLAEQQHVDATGPVLQGH